MILFFVEAWGSRDDTECNNMRLEEQCGKGRPITNDSQHLKKNTSNWQKNRSDNVYHFSIRSDHLKRNGEVNKLDKLVPYELCENQRIRLLKSIPCCMCETWIRNIYFLLETYHMKKKPSIYEAYQKKHKFFIIRKI